MQRQAYERHRQRRCVERRETNITSYELWIMTLYNDFGYKKQT